MKQLQTTLANIIILFGCVIVCLSLTINDDIRAIRSILMGSSLPQKRRKPLTSIDNLFAKHEQQP